MSKMTKELLVQLAAVVRREAKRRGDNAGYGGRMDDGGQRAMEESIAMYEAGFSQEIPKEYQPYVDNIIKERDPEYLDYLRLQKKFENK